MANQDFGSCFFGMCSLKFGTIIITILSMAFPVLDLFLLLTGGEVFLLITYQKMATSTSRAHFIFLNSYYLLDAIVAISCVAGLFGIITEKPKLLCPWIASNVISFMFSIVVLIMNIFTVGFVRTIILSFIRSGAIFFFILLVFSHHSLMESRPARNKNTTKFNQQI